MTWNTFAAGTSRNGVPAALIGVSTPEQDAAAREVAALGTELAEITETLAWLDEVAATVDRLCTPEYIQAKLREVLAGAGYDASHLDQAPERAEPA